MAYSLTDYAVLNLLTSAVTEVTIPAPPAVSAGMGGMGMGMGMGAFSGLFGAKAKPTVISVSDKEVLVNKDSKHVGLPRLLLRVLTCAEDNGLFIGADGKPTRTDRIEWSGPPEEMGYSFLLRDLFLMYIDIPPQRSSNPMCSRFSRPEPFQPQVRTNPASPS